MEGIESPRLRELARAFPREGGALERFWRGVRAQGAPLVESLEDAADARLVTFVFRGGADTRHVVVGAGPAGFSPQENRMRRLGDTDLWFRSYRVPRDTRCFYHLAENGPLVAPWETTDHAALEASWRPDPLNPRRYRIVEREDAPEEVSLLELADAPALVDRRLRQSVPRGRVRQHALDSRVLGHERPLRVYTPAAELGPARALLIVFDGVAFTSGIPTPALLDKLAADARIPPTLAVFVDSLGERRNLDLPCSRRFVRFLVEELLPWIEADHGAFAAEATVLAGASFGGVCSAHAALCHPERFGNVLSLSGSYWVKVAGDLEWAGLVRRVAQGERRPVRVYMNVGRFERGSRVFARAPGQLEANRAMRDALRAKGYALQYREFSGGHDWACWEQTLPEGLEALLGGGAL